MAARRNIDIYRGDTYSHEITLEDESGSPIDITGRLFSSQVRRKPGSPTAAATFSVMVNDPTAGVVVVWLTSEQTSQLEVGRYHWDFQQVVGDLDLMASVTTLLSGDVTVTDEVTR